MLLQRPVNRLSAVAGLAVVVAAMSTAPAFGAFIYGIDDNNNIHEVNTDTQSSTTVYTNGTIPAGVSNAFAYDTARDQFFFIDSNNDLQFWTRVGNPSTLVSAATLGLNPSDPAEQPQNAAYYNNAYWFFYEGTNTLNRVSFTYAGGLPTTPVVDDFNLSQAAGGTGPASWTNTFGDIAINTTTGILYGATQSGVFFSVDLNGTPTTATSISQGNPSLQLSFNDDYSILYGQAFTGGQWYTVNTTTGAATSIPGFAITFGGTDGLRDLGGAASTSAVVPEIDPASFGSAFAMLLGVLALIERRSLRRLSLSGIA